MKIRRYLGNNSQEAILKVKMDLGSDALILNTRKVRKKGLLKFFSKPMVEVLAAIDEDYGSARRTKKALQKTEDRKSTDFYDDKKSFDKKEEKISELENKIN